MGTVEFNCPHCESLMHLNLINMQTGAADTKTMTCRSCNEQVTFGYQIKPLYRGSMYKNRDWMEDQYVRKNKTMSEIGALCGKSAMTIRDWLKRLDIPVRSRGPRD